MYAIVVTGGKQYRVAKDQVIRVEKIEMGEGETFNFDKVLLVGEGSELKIGAPYLAGSKVVAQIMSHGRSDKVNIIKFRRRKHHMKRQGHRQHYTDLKITSIE